MRQGEQACRVSSAFIRPDQGLCSVAAAARMVTEGRILVLAGAERDLAALPEGCWVGGTCGHFVTPQGGAEAGGQLYYVDFTALAASASWRSFDARSLSGLARHYPANGFAILLIPGFSRLLGQVAGRIMEYDGIYNLPLMGWVSSLPFAAIGADESQRPKIFAGGPRAQAERAAVLYVTLPAQYFAQLQIANLFTPGTGPQIRFAQAGQDIAGDCLIGGRPANLARYIADQKIDPRLPLVADQDGALLSVAILSADAAAGRVVLFAPVSPALTYRFAETVVDYDGEFTRAAAALALDQAAHAGACALQYDHANAAGGSGAGFYAPVTFGEIAYTVLNQTLICLHIGRHEVYLEDFAP